MRNMIHRYVMDMTGDRMASGYSHCQRVYHLARELDEDFDDDILYAACFLHDIVVGDDGHRKSAVKAEQILHETGFPADKISAVYESIESHWPGSRPKLKEAKMLHDANLLDSLGAIGLIRLSVGSFFWHHKYNIKDVLDLIKWYRNRADDLIYPKAKELAKIKIEFMDTAIKELDEEQHL